MHLFTFSSCCLLGSGGQLVISFGFLGGFWLDWIVGKSWLFLVCPHLNPKSSHNSLHLYHSFLHFKTEIMNYAKSTLSVIILFSYNIYFAGKAEKICMGKWEEKEEVAFCTNNKWIGKKARESSFFCSCTFYWFFYLIV
jgi:hypothetical protein